jgi:fructan beta-fructosidase
MRRRLLLILSILLFIIKAEAQKEPYRPQFHFTPKTNWMNDPNGTIYHNGLYHLYFQHNPLGKEWGHMSWGHATSNDLLHWQHQPVAISEDDSTWIFSGSVVIDSFNVSGLGTKQNPPFLAFYTGVHKNHGFKQMVDMAYSIDKGMTYKKFVNNPLIAIDPSKYIFAKSEKEKAVLNKFGDPQVFWYEKDQKWIMVNIHRKDTGRVMLYESKNLISWAYLSEYNHPDYIGVYECPVFRQIPVANDGSKEKWLMKWDMPYQSYYVIGEFDGTNFIPDENSKVNSLDNGNFYASIAWNGIPNKLVITGWITEEPRDDKAWTGVQSLPRELFLEKEEGGYILKQMPYVSLNALKNEKYTFQDITLSQLNQKLHKRNCVGKAMEINAEIDLGKHNEFAINVLHGIGEGVTIHYNADKSELSIVNGFKPYKTRCSMKSNKLKLKILIDHSVIEIFANDGEVVLSGSCYPNPATDQNISVQGNENLIIEIFKVNLIK